MDYNFLNHCVELTFILAIKLSLELTPNKEFHYFFINNFLTVSKCFHDQAKPEADLVKITLKDDKNATCAKFTSNMTLDVMYQDYAQNVRKNFQDF